MFNHCQCCLVLLIKLSIFYRLINDATKTTETLRTSWKTVASSVTRRLGFLFHVWPFKTMKIAQRRSKLCQIVKYLKNCQRLLRFCQSGEISSNLVTLVASVLLFCFVRSLSLFASELNETLSNKWSFNWVLTVKNFILL